MAMMQGTVEWSRLDEETRAFLSSARQWTLTLDDPAPPFLDPPPVPRTTIALVDEVSADVGDGGARLRVAELHQRL